MVRKFKSIALAGALMIVASPVFADDLMTPLGNIDLDPFHILTPAPAAAPAAAPAPMAKKHHRAKKVMHKKMMMKKKKK